MREIFLTFLLFTGLPVAAEDFNISLSAEQWDMPRQGEALLQQSDLAGFIRQWQMQPGSLIEIRYPGGEEGELWVGELVDWLVALGVPSAAIQAFAGSGDEDRIYLVLKQGK
jgi:hypothetical protein